LRSVVFDLETTDLKAITGHILCCSFVEIDPFNDKGHRKPYTFRLDKKPWRGRSVIDDSRLVRAIREELLTYNMVITWNGKMFDLPMLNARLLKHDLPRCEPQFHLDPMWQAKGSQNRIGSAKLNNVQKFLGLASSKTEISWDEWQEAAALQTKAMDTVVKHCEFDVEVTAQAYWKLLPSVKNIHR
jgi:uncharacterized protein YprB with RNaseH-like and TPR domain